MAGSALALEMIARRCREYSVFEIKVGQIDIIPASSTNSAK